MAHPHHLAFRSQHWTRSCQQQACCLPARHVSPSIQGRACNAWAPYGCSRRVFCGAGDAEKGPSSSVHNGYSAAQESAIRPEDRSAAYQVHCACCSQCTCGSSLAWVGNSSEQRNAADCRRSSLRWSANSCSCPAKNRCASSYIRSRRQCQCRSSYGLLRWRRKPLAIRNR